MLTSQHRHLRPVPRTLKRWNAAAAARLIDSPNAANFLEPDDYDLGLIVLR